MLCGMFPRLEEAVTEGGNNQLNLYVPRSYPSANGICESS